MTSAPSSEGATTPEQSYAETTSVGMRGDVEDKPVKAAPKRARKGKAEGQWALGYREPLNKNEQSKNTHGFHEMNMHVKASKVSQ